MSLFLTKLLAVFVYPLSAAIPVGTVALTLSFTRLRHVGQMLMAAVLVALWISATPIFADWLNWRLVSQIPQVKIAALQPSDAVILLGGASESRILCALEIYRSGKAPRILISGGNLPWGRAAAPESEQIADLLVQVGVPRSALILETSSRTTRENAVNSAAVFREYGLRDGILVTTASHMPRALAAFKKVGLDLEPAALVYGGPPQLDSLFDLLPNAEALAATTSAVKELIGLQLYRLSGWA
jgi:uncharacterized SAM-binding protein YcdF (DUF218 family)